MFRPSRSKASYQLLNERHLAVHRALVALTGSNRLVALADSLGGELKVALAQIDRLRRNAHDQAASHKVLVELLESGQVAAAAAELERHLAGAAVEVAEAIGLSGSGQAASAAAGA